MPAVNESSTVEWHNPQVTPTRMSSPVGENVPFTPTTAFSCSNASVTAGSFRSTALPRSASVTLDGVSRTVNEVRDAEDGSTHFAVNIIPHTAQHTTLGALAQGQQLNVEVDVLARYIDRMLAVRAH